MSGGHGLCGVGHGHRAMTIHAFCTFLPNWLRRPKTPGIPPELGQYTPNWATLKAPAKKVTAHAHMPNLMSHTRNTEASKCPVPS